MTDTATVAPDGTDAAWEQAWYSISSKQRDTAPRVAILEVFADSSTRCHYTLHNVNDTGLPVAERRAAQLTEKTSGRTFVARVIA